MKKGYRENERSKSSNLIQNTNLFDGAESGRIIKHKGKDHPKDEILLDGINNIYEPIRKDVREYFLKNKISFWHVPRASEPPSEPTGHTLSSQICCINHLFPIRQDEETVLSIAKLFCPDIKKIFPIKEYLPGYIQFEAISKKDYLHESKLIRGSNCTSVDALIYGELDNGKKIIIPIEWKYTEHYDNKDKSTEDRRGEAEGTEGKGKERLERYSELINNSQYLQNSQYLNGLSNYRESVYFIEPFYQLMRQTLWAEQMIKHNNTETIKADDYIHIHIIPKNNIELLEKKYKPDGKNMEDTWRGCLKNTEKYKIIDPKDLIKILNHQKYGDLIKYLNKRYWE
jgi:hypothetical protein